MSYITIEQLEKNEQIVNKLLARFEEGNTIILTKEEELAILHQLEEADYLGCGTTRATYMWQDKYVVKIGVAEQGATQNEVEFGFYQDHWTSGRFATLYAHGQFINVMERLVNLDDAEEEEFVECVDELNWMTDYDGGDNEQVGWSKEREMWCAYDYGYDSEHDRWLLVGNIEDMGYLSILEVAIDDLTNDVRRTTEELLDLNRLLALEEGTPCPLDEVEKTYGKCPEDFKYGQWKSEWGDWNQTNARWGLYSEAEDRYWGSFEYLAEAIEEAKAYEQEHGTPCYIVDIWG